MPCGSYDSDFTGGQTYAGNAGSSGADYAFDNNTSNYFGHNTGGWTWFQVQTSGAKTPEKLSVTGRYTWDPPRQIILKASNTGAFAGEETTLYTSAESLSWTAGETKSYEFENSSSFTYFRFFVINSSGAVVVAEAALFECLGATYAGASSDGAKFGDSAAADYKNRGDVADGVGIGDAVEGFDFSGGIADGAGVGDAVAAESEINEAAADAAGIGDAVSAFSLSDSFDLTVGVGDAVDAGFERVGELVDAAGIGDAADGLNWTVWLRDNEDQAVIRYYCTLTGAEDGTTDVELPVGSFQARKRQGESNYLSVIVPGMAYAEAIAARSNGQLVIDMAYLVRSGGEWVEEIREEIVRVDLESINIYNGASNRSINLSGYREATYVAKGASLRGCTYSYSYSGARGFRFAKADPYLNPGDALTVEDTGDELTVNQISYAIAARGYKSMEVREA